MEIAPNEDRIKEVVKESSMLVLNDDAISSCNNS
jgi:hypothetical protein